MAFDYMQININYDQEIVFLMEIPNSNRILRFWFYNSLPYQLVRQEEELEEFEWNVLNKLRLV